MSTHTVNSTSESLPALSLPAGSHPPSHPLHEHDVQTDPPEIEPIEHRLRVDFIDGPLITPHSVYGPADPEARKCARRTLNEQYEKEQKYHPTLPDTGSLEKAPEFLKNQLRPHYEELKDIQQRRLDWYTDHIPRDLDQILGTVKSLIPDKNKNSTFDANNWVGMVVVPDDTSTSTYASEHGLDEKYVNHEADLDDCIPPSGYRVSLPAPLLIGDYANGSRYSLIPWSDGLVCGCPYKQKHPSRIMCKHELVSAMYLNHEDGYILPIDEGLAVPQRARRFVSPTIAHSHTPRQPDSE